MCTTAFLQIYPVSFDSLYGENPKPDRSKPELFRPFRLRVDGALDILELIGSFRKKIIILILNIMTIIYHYVRYVVLNYVFEVLC
jgi:hypothetical protein